MRQTGGDVGQRTRTKNANARERYFLTNNGQTAEKLRKKLGQTRLRSAEKGATHPRHDWTVDTHAKVLPPSKDIKY